MRYVIVAIYSISFLFLLSCDSGEGGTLPSESQESKTFAKTTESVKRFLEANPGLQFTDGGGGFDFADEELRCLAKTMIAVNTSEMTLTSLPCFFEGDDFSSQEFQMGGIVALAQNLSLVVFVSFIDMGIPETGTHVGQLICDDFCYSSISLYAYVIQGDEIHNFYHTHGPTIQVTNSRGIVTAGFDETFFDEYDVPVYTISGDVSCCN